MSQGPKQTLQEKIAQACHILDLYSSPFPDAQERTIKEKQQAYINELRAQLRDNPEDTLEP